MSLVPLEWVKERKQGKRLFANAQRNRIDWLKRVKEREDYFQAYAKYFEESNTEENELGDHVLTETFEDTKQADAPKTDPQHLRLLCAGLGVTGVFLILLSLLR